MHSNNRLLQGELIVEFVVLTTEAYWIQAGTRFHSRMVFVEQNYSTSNVTESILVAMGLMRNCYERFILEFLP